MALFRDHGGIKSLDKLFNKDWSRLFYNEPAESWEEKCLAVLIEAWKQFSIFLETRVRQFSEHWYICAVLVAGTLFVITIHKSLRYLAAIKFREKDNSGIQNGEQPRPVAQGAEIVSNNDNNGRGVENDGARKDESFVVEACPTFPNLCDAITARDNDQTSSISSEATIVPADAPYTNDDFSNDLVETIDRDDQLDCETFLNKKKIDNSAPLDYVESTFQKVDSENCKIFYVLTPWIETSDRTAPSSGKSLLSIVDRPSSTINVTVESTKSNSNNFVMENREGGPIVPITRSHDQEDPGSGDNVVSTLENLTDETVISSSSLKESIEERLLKDRSPVVRSTTDENLDNRSAYSHRPLEEIDNGEMGKDEIVMAIGSDMRTDSKQRFRSLSHEARAILDIAWEASRRRRVLIVRRGKRFNRRSPGPTHPWRILRPEPAGTMSTEQCPKLPIISEPEREIREGVTIGRSRNSMNLRRSSIDSTTSEVSKIPLPRKSPRDRASQ